MRFLLIDHVYHQKTKSSNVLFDILNCFDCDLETYYVDPDNTNAIPTDIKNIIELGSKQWDAVFLWQIDYLGSYFSRKGHKVFIFPMVDASLSLPDAHWRLLDSCNFVCFSLALHSKISRYTQSSRFYQFYPKNYATSIETSGKDSAFFWLRDPSSLINLKNVLSILPSCVSKLHIHTSENNKQTIEHQFHKHSRPGLELTISSWFETQQDYLNTMKKSLFFIAPRESEGIGLSVVEALQLNRIVIAHDSPTHNEYISNFKNGILIDFNNKSKMSPVFIDDNAVSKILYNLNRQHSLKSEAWNVSKTSMIKFIKSSIYGNKSQSKIIKEEHEYLESLLLCHIDQQKYFASINNFASRQIHEDQNSVVLNALEESSKLFINGEFQKSLDCIQNAKIQYPDSDLLDSRINFISSYLKSLKK